MMRLSHALPCLALFSVVFLSACASQPEAQEEVYWHIVNESRQEVMVEFYSQNRDKAWPGGRSAYVIAPQSNQGHTLTCRSAELICYGAWHSNNASHYWGAGRNDENDCTNCCISCQDGSKAAITLQD